MGRLIQPALSERTIKPTPQRAQHSRLERAERIQDVDGNASLPWRAETLLARWERVGDITTQQRAAGDRFHALFHLACLDPLKAADMGRAGGCSVALGHHGSVGAQDEVNKAMKLLGGHGTQEGCGAWIVLGCDYSIAKWIARETYRGRWMHNRKAKRVLIEVLGKLVMHFGY